MSGSRALASARRRRASPDDPRVNQRSPPPPPQQVSSVESPTHVTSNKAPQKINPGAMLMNHNKLIENLQQVVTNLNENMDSYGTDTSELRNKIDALRMDDGNIEYFKNKVAAMEQQMNDIKKHILKVQTFAMETNLQYMQLKKQLNIGEEHDSKLQMKQAETTSEILSSHDNNFSEKKLI
jgi:hypothetical protein